MAWNVLEAFSLNITARFVFSTLKLNGIDEHQDQNMLEVGRKSFSQRPDY